MQPFKLCLNNLSIETHHSIRYLNFISIIIFFNSSVVGSFDKATYLRPFRSVSPQVTSITSGTSRLLNKFSLKNTFTEETALLYFNFIATGKPVVPLYEMSSITSPV